MFGKIKRFATHTLDVFESVMAIIGIYLTACSIRDLWSEELRRRYSIKTRLGILAFYLVHFAALVLATGLFAELLLSASMATLLVNMTSIINDLYDYLQETYFNFKRKRKLRKLEREFPILNSSFQQNNLFLKEFVELRDEIENLSSQQNHLVLLNSQLDDDSVANTQIFEEQLTKIANLMKSKCEFIVAEQIVVDRYYQKHGFEIDENKVIKETNAEIQVINEHKKQISLTIQDLMSQRLQDSDDITFYQSQLISLDNTIKKRAIVNQHFYKLSKAKEALVDVDYQLSNLDAKYQNAPYNSYEEIEREPIKELERNYLLERITSLQDFINNPIQSVNASVELNQADIWINAQNTLEKLEGSPDKIALRNILSEQINVLELMLIDANNQFAKKKEFIQAITVNPNQDIKQDFDKIYKTGKEIIEIKKQIHLATLEEKHKLMSTSISVLTACTVFLISFFSYRIDTLIFEGFNRALSIFGAVASLWGRQENLRAEATHQEIEEREIQKLNDECAERAHMVPDTALQTDCVNLMQRLSRKLDERYPRRRVMSPENTRHRTYLPRTTLPRPPPSPKKEVATLQINEPLAAAAGLGSP